MVVNSDTASEKDWEHVQKSSNLVVGDVTTNKYKIYQSVTSFWITTTDNKYLGHISGKFTTINNYKTFVITSSFAVMKGMYGVLFFNLIKNSDVKIILSDDQQSTRARDSWKKVLNAFLDHAIVYENGKILKYDKDTNYWDNSEHKNTRVGLSYKGSLMERFDTLMGERFLSKVVVSNPFRDYAKMYIKNDKSVDVILYTEAILNI